MRVINEIPHPQYKITVFSWNGKYLLKFEAGPYEQTYKVSETDVAGDDDIQKLINAAFLEHITDTFKKMHAGFELAVGAL